MFLAQTVPYIRVTGYMNGPDLVVHVANHFRLDRSLVRKWLLRSFIHKSCIHETVLQEQQFTQGKGMPVCCSDYLRTLLLTE